MADKKNVFLLMLMVILASGCLESTKPDWAHEVVWQGPGENADIEAQLWAQVAPYGLEYDHVNITATKDGAILRLRVIGTSNSVEFMDIYDFEYSSGTLTRTGYLLEAMPPQDRDSAIAIAMQSPEVRSAAVTGIPTVRRILPDTSMKYYEAKTLLSVSWNGVSALVDPQEGKVVNVWNGNKK